MIEGKLFLREPTSVYIKNPPRSAWRIMACHTLPTYLPTTRSQPQTMSIFFLLALTSFSLLNSPHQVQSFSIGSRRLAVSGRGTILLSSPSSSTTRLFSSNDTDDKQAEIAALEERLRQLKEEEGITEAKEELQKQIAKLDTDELAMLEKIEETDDSIMFSEKWKEGGGSSSDIAAEEEGLGAIAKVGLAIAGVVLLALFSQVPVGESDLQKYQDVKASTSRIDLGDLNPDVRVQQ